MIRPAASALPLTKKRPRISRMILSGLLLVLCGGVGPTIALADVPPPSQDFRESETTPEKQRTVTAAIYMLVLVTVGVVTLLVLIMLWGARVRREARKPLATTSPNDPLWYLKKPAKPSPGEPNPSESVSEETDTANKPSDDV